MARCSITRSRRRSWARRSSSASEASKAPGCDSSMGSMVSMLILGGQLTQIEVIEKHVNLSQLSLAIRQGWSVECGTQCLVHAYNHLTLTLQNRIEQIRQLKVPQIV